MDTFSNPNDIFVYDETSPSCLKWKIDRYGGINKNSLIVKKGTDCGTLNKHNKYWHVQFRGSPKPAHRVIWEMFYGETDVVVSHLNGDKSDNRLSNLIARKAIKNSVASACADAKEWSKIFKYCEESPSKLVWIIDNYTGCKGTVLKAKQGDFVNTVLGKDGYYTVPIGTSKSSKKLHNIIYELCCGIVSEGNVVDHIDGDNQNNTISNLREVTWTVNARNKKLTSRNTSGVNGVNSKISKGHKLYRATWNSLEGKSLEKSFSVGKYGEEEAFRLACEYRLKMIEELNAQGAMYSERHGKEFVRQS
jgi:hypothetical protein